MKKILFTVSFFAAATAFAIFIPLQKDGSVRWTSNSQGYATVEGLVAPITGKRMPAGQNNPDAYVPPPVEQPYTQPVEQPQPVYTQPTPTYSGNYSCLKEGFKRAGYSNISQGYINMVAARSKMHYDGAKSGGFFFWGGQVDERKNFISSIKNSIFTLSALGPCRDYPNVGGEFLERTATYEEYAATFRISTAAVGKGYITPWNPTGQAAISSKFNNSARKQNGQIYNCTKVKESAVVSANLCRKLIQTCSEMICGAGRNCGVGNVSECDYKDPSSDSNGHDHGDDTGGHTNGTDTGHTTDGSTTSSSGQHETPNGEHDNNHDQGYGDDGSGGGAGQGDGPPGS